MSEKRRPETLEGDWDRLYREYPEVYDEFASVPYKPPESEIINNMFDLNGKVIIDIGSGTGLSTFPLAKYANLVIGIELEEVMLKIAVKNAKKQKIKNVMFVKGSAHFMPFKDDSVYAVVSITAPTPPLESMRIIKQKGYIISFDVPPKWYGGELAPIFPENEESTDEEKDITVWYTKLGFKSKDFFNIQEYGSLDKILRTYGFIHGKKAINYLKKHDKTSIKWKWRIHYKQKTASTQEECSKLKRIIEREKG